MGAIGIILNQDIDSMRIELVRDLGIEPTNYEKKLHIAFVDQNLSSLCQYQFRNVLCWANRIVTANFIRNNIATNILRSSYILG